MSASLAEVSALFAERRSCRGFLGKPVPQPLLAEILETAQRTASWCNSQPWQVIVTYGEATEGFRNALYAHAASEAPGEPDFAFPREYRGTYRDRRRDAGYRLYEAVGIGREDAVGRARQSLENFRLFGAPHVAIISSDEALGPYGAVDCGGYVANFLMAAQAAGIATIPQAAFAYHSPFVRQYFNLGEDRRIVCGISFGYPDPDHPANTVVTDRASLPDAVTIIGGNNCYYK